MDNRKRPIGKKWLISAKFKYTERIIINYCRDLETKIDQEQSRVSSNNSERINADLEAIIQENALLVAQIKSASVKTK